MGMTIEDAKMLDRFLCSDCSPDDHANRSLNHFPVSPSIETKVSPSPFPFSRHAQASARENDV